MNVTLSLSPEQETRLEESLRKRDRNRVRQILSEAIESTIDDLLETDHRLTLEEFERLADELADRLELATGGETPVLRDEHISRAGIYGDHP